MSIMRIRMIVLAAAMATMLSTSCTAAEPEKKKESDAIAAAATKTVSDTVSVKGAKLPVPLPKIPDAAFDVKKQGAVGDGVAEDTAAIQKAIDAAGAAGGGKVVFPAGTYLCGPINLVSNIDFNLAEGATLLMLPIDRYPVVNGEHPALITGNKLSDIRFSGSGTIDGQGEPWWTKFRADELKLKRPRLVYLSRIERIEVTGIHLKNPPMFHLTFNMDTDVTVDGITIATPYGSPNTDGIQIKGSNYVIRNCSISNGDDNIVFGGPSTDASIYNCKFGTGHGVSMGSYTRGGISNVTVDNCTFDGTVNGLRGKSQYERGGVVENIAYSNITMSNVKDPIYFISYYDDKVKDPNLNEPEPMTDLTPVWRNISFTNITGTTTDESRRNAAILWGTPEAPIENFVFKNVKLTAQKPFKVYHCKNITFADDVQVTVPAGQEQFLLFDAANIKLPGVKGARNAQGRQDGKPVSKPD